MATARLLKTFADIYTRCANELKIQIDNTTDLNRLKTIIQEVYLDKVVPSGQWKWLRDFLDTSLPATYRTGTAALTQGATAVTLTNAPTISTEGYWFSVQGSNVRYRVASHAAGSVSLQLEAPFAEATNATANFDLWIDRLSLPVDWRETIQVLNDQDPTPLKAQGMQKFREMELVAPKYMGRPKWYSTGDFVDPDPYAAISGFPAISTSASAGNIRTLVFSSDVSAYLIQGQRIQIAGSANFQFNGRFVISSVSSSTITYSATQRYNKNASADASLALTAMSTEGSDERYREVYLYPALNTFTTNLHLMGIKEVPPLIEDTDEPWMPVSDRNVLVYGALAIAWSSIGRNTTESARNQQMFENKIADMLAKIDDSTDLPQLKPSSAYMNVKRMPMRYRRKFLFTSGN